MTDMQISMALGVAPQTLLNRLRLASLESGRLVESQEITIYQNKNVAPPAVNAATPSVFKQVRQAFGATVSAMSAWAGAFGVVMLGAVGGKLWFWRQMD